MLYNAHISKVGVKRIMQEVIVEAYIRWSANIGHQLYRKAFAPRAGVMEDLLADPIAANSIRDSLAE